MSNLIPSDESFDKKMLAGNYEKQTSVLFMVVAMHATKTWAGHPSSNENCPKVGYEMI